MVDLLYDLSQSFQHCIYTTHHEPWRDRYRWGWLRDGQCHFVDLVGWSHEAGIQHGGSVPPIDELRDLLAAPVPARNWRAPAPASSWRPFSTFLRYSTSAPCRGARES